MGSLQHANIFQKLRTSDAQVMAELISISPLIDKMIHVNSVQRKAATKLCRLHRGANTEPHMWCSEILPRKGSICIFFTSVPEVSTDNLQPNTFSCRRTVASENNNPKSTEIFHPFLLHCTSFPSPPSQKPSLHTSAS